MKSSYTIIELQTDMRIELAKSWQKNGFYDFAKSTILQAYDAVERFEKRLDRFGNTFEKFEDVSAKCFAENVYTHVFSNHLRNNLKRAVEEMDKIIR